MFLVCTFLVFILTVQFKLGWRWKNNNKRWRHSWITFLCICCTCYCWYCIWYSDAVLNYWNSVVCHIVVSWKKKRSISLWFSQWWQRRLSYLNGFYHFCSYWYYTSVIEITWQKKKRTENMLMQKQTEINIDWCTQLRAWFSLSVTTISCCTRIVSRPVLLLLLAAYHDLTSVYLCFLKWAITYWWSSS